MTNLEIILGGILTIVVFPFLKDYLKSKFIDSTYELDKAFEEVRDLNNIMNKLRLKYNASRVFIMEYHNGGKYYSGKPKQKTSMKVESFDPRVKPLLKEWQELPIGFFSNFTYYMNLEGKTYIKDINSLSDVTYKRILQEKDVNSTICFSVYKKKRFPSKKFPFFVDKTLLVSTVHIWFKEENFNGNLSEERNMILEKEVNRIKQILTR